MKFGTTAIRLEDLIERLVKQVQKHSGLPQDLVFETLADDADHCEFPAGDRFVTLAPQRFTPIAGDWAGGGRYAKSYDATFRIACLCRFASDQELRSGRELRDKTRSHMALLLKICDGLTGWQMPTAADATASHLREPINPPELEVKPKRVGKTPWAVAAATLRFSFVLALPSGSSDPT